MFQWTRNTKGKLAKTSVPQESDCAVNLNFDPMEPPHEEQPPHEKQPPHEEQQSQQGVEMNLNAFRSMRDHIHPPRMSAPSCIVPPTEDMVVRPYLVPLLPTFHGMESENPYTHIRKFEEVCNTFNEEITTLDLTRLKLFPLTLKDKAKIWLNSLRPRSIRN